MRAIIANTASVCDYLQVVAVDLELFHHGLRYRPHTPRFNTVGLGNVSRACSVPLPPLTLYLLYFVSSCRGQVRIWNISTGQCLRWSRVDIAVVSLSFHPSGHMLAVAGGHTVYLWDYLVRGGREVYRAVFVVGVFFASGLLWVFCVVTGSLH